MKTFLKFVVAMFCLFALGIAGLMALAFHPGVQRAVVLHLLGNQPGVSAHLDTIKIRPNSLEVKGFDLYVSGFGMHIGDAQLEFDVLDVLLNRDIRVGDARIAGAVFDFSDWIRLRNAKRPAGAALEDLFSGVFPYTEWGYRLWVENLRLDGEMRFPDERRVTLDLSGGGIAPGATAKLNYQGFAESTGRGATVSRIKITGIFELTQSQNEGLTFAALESTTEVNGFTVAGSPILKQRVELVKNEGGIEQYRISVYSGDPGRSAQELIAMTSEFDINSGQFSGAFSVSAGHIEIAPYIQALGLPLPDFSVTGTGRYAFREKTGDGSITAALEMRVANLEVLQKELAVAGELDLLSEIDVSIAAGAVAVSKIEVSIKDSQGKRPLQVINLQSFTLDPEAQDLGLSEVEGELLRLSLDRMPVAWVASYLPALGLRGDAVSGALTLSRDGGTVRIGAVKPLVVNDFSLLREGAVILDNLDLTFDPEAFYDGAMARLKLGVKARETVGESVFEGVLESEVALKELRAGRFPLKGRITIRLHRLMDQPFASAFPPPPSGDLSLISEFDLSVENDQALVRRSANWVVDGNGGRLLSLDFKQPFTLVSAAPYFSLSKSSGVLLEAEMKEFPLTLLAPYLSGIAVTGDWASGVVSLEKFAPEVYQLNAVKPLAANGVTISREGEVMLRDFSFSGSPRITIAPERLDVTWDDLDLRSGKRKALAGRGSISFGREPTLRILRANGLVTADLPAINAQPWFSEIGNISAGRVILDGSFDREKANRIDLRVEITGLESAGSPGERVDKGTFSVQGTVSPESVALTSPVAMSGTGGETSLELKFGYKPSGNRKLFILEATGSSLAVDDVLTVVEAFSPRREFAARGERTRVATHASGNGLPTGAVVPDAQPFWAGYAGRAKIQVGKVSHRGAGHADSVETVLAVQPDKLSIERFEALMAGSPLSVSGGVAFRAGHPRPYLLQADLGFQNFDLGKFLRAAAPDSPPTVEGVFSGLGKASGEGETLNLMFEKTMGSVALKSVRGGVFRGLKANGKANFAVGMGALIGGFADRPGLVALSRMTQALREVPYSEAALLLERGESLDVDLKRLVILGPTLQAIGIGKTQYREGVPITEQPMQVNLHLAAKGSLANDLYILDLLAGEKNELEYWPLKNRYQPIPLTGSLSKIDPRAFYSLAASAANSARSRSSAEIGVLGRAESTAGAGDNLDGAAAESSQIQPDKAPAREPTPGEILLEAILNRARSQGGP